MPVKRRARKNLKNRLRSTQDNARKTAAKSKLSAVAVERKQQINHNIFEQIQLSTLAVDLPIKT